MQGGWKSRLRGNVSGSEGRDLLRGLLYRVENNTNGRRICPTIARNRHLLFFDESPLEISRNRQPVVHVCRTGNLTPGFFSTGMYLDVV